MQDEGNVVLTMNIGETKILFCDNYCLSIEESEKLMERVASNAFRSYMILEHKKRQFAGVDAHCLESK